MIETEDMFYGIAATLANEAASKEPMPLMHLDQSTAQWTPPGKANHPDYLGLILLLDHQYVLKFRVKLKNTRGGNNTVFHQSKKRPD